MLKIGSKVVLNNFFIDDEDLQEFLEKNNVKHVYITEIEDENFWGITDKNLQIPYHLELSYVKEIIK